MATEKTLKVMADMDCVANSLHTYAVELGCMETADGFLATALTGDEDKDTIEIYQKVFQPIKKAITEIRAAYTAIEKGILEPAY